MRDLDRLLTQFDGPPGITGNEGDVSQEIHRGPRFHRRRGEIAFHSLERGARFLGEGGGSIQIPLPKRQRAVAEQRLREEVRIARLAGQC